VDFTALLKIKILKIDTNKNLHGITDICSFFHRITDISMIPQNNRQIQVFNYNIDSEAKDEALTAIRQDGAKQQDTSYCKYQ
jgi:hypothetical protein